MTQNIGGEINPLCIVQTNYWGLVPLSPSHGFGAYGCMCDSVPTNQPSQVKFTLSPTPTMPVDVGRNFESVCLFVRSITQKRMIPKCSNLVLGMTLGLGIP